MNSSNQIEFSLLTSWEEIESSIINSIVAPFFQQKHGGQTLDRLTQRALLSEVCQRLKQPIYKNAQMEGVVSTLRYLYQVIRVGIFVCIKDNKIKAFIPFANGQYRNNWSEQIRFAKSFKNKKGRIINTTTADIAEYLKYKKRVLFSVRETEMDKSKWSANAYFVNSGKLTDVWGTHSLSEFYDMLSATVNSHKVKDCIFFINKRDYPLLRKDLKEPYFFLWEKENAPQVDLNSIQFNGSMSPILSPYTSNDYMDLPIPIAQDWILASEPENYFNANSVDSDWNAKQPTAFFRGSLTGRVDIELNPRALIAKLNVEWKQTKFSTTNGKKIPLLDAGVTSWNLSDKVDKNSVIRFTQPKQMPFKLSEKVPMNESVKKYKYILNLDGHARPNRTGYLLSSGSLMIMVETKYVVGSITWIDNVLKPWVHYVPVKADLSDLEKQIRWCISHDDECKKIVANAKQFAQKYFIKDTITEYLSYVLNAIANRNC